MCNEMALCCLLEIYLNSGSQYQKLWSNRLPNCGNINTNDLLTTKYAPNSSL